MPQPVRSFRKLLCLWFLGFLAVALTGVPVAAAAEPEDYSLPDTELKWVRLDSAQTESFFSVRADTEGRLFVGGREGLFVYEPYQHGGYAPRKEILHFPDHTWINDIEFRGNDLYLSTVSALYRVPDGRIKRDGLKVERLVWGVPLGSVHQCFHALAWGPEGDLYFSMGDPLTSYGDFSRPDHWGHWTFFSKPDPGAPKSAAAVEEGEWIKTPHTGVGGVFRCRPDGSRFQVVARGLRNACGLVFDQHWNLFTNDNDHESLPADYVPGRLMQVTPHSDFSWPRGWMVEKTPDRADLLQTMITTMGRAVPVGQSYYHETFFPEKYRDNLVVARWCTRKLARYPLAHRGASFETEEAELLECRDLARPVGVSVGRGGRIFAAVCFMAQNEGSPTYKSDVVMITRADDPAMHPYEGYDITAVSPDALWRDLSDQSWGRRYRAHLEILRRGGPLLGRSIERLESVEADDPAIRHLPWLAAATRNQTAQKLLIDLAAHPDAQIRLTTIRALGEYFPVDSSRPTLLAALDDPNPQVKQAAVCACFDMKLTPAMNLLIQKAAASADSYIRQAAAFVLAEQASLADLERLCGAATPAARLAGVLAVGFRLTMPAVSAPIAPQYPLEKWSADNVYKIRFFDKQVDLREYGRAGMFTVAEHWKASKHTTEQEQLFSLLQLRLDDPDEKVRLEAAHFLSLLGDTRAEPKIAAVRSARQQQLLNLAPIKSIDKVWLAGPFPDGEQGFSASHPPEMGVIDLEAKYPVADKEIAWQMAQLMKHYNFRQLLGDCDRSSIYAYTRLESGTRQPALLMVGSDDGVKVWQNGKLVWSNDVTRGALPFQDVVPVELEPGSNDFLIRVRNVAGDSGMYLHYRAVARVAHVLPEKLGANRLAERLKAAAANPGAKSVDPAFLTTDWTSVAKQGSADRGRKLFGAAGLGCAKCHSITPDAAVTGGPSLAEAVKRFTIPHLVQSILLPSEQVSPVFKSSLIVTNEGKTFTGLVVSETAEKLEMLLTDATRVSIPKSQIEERKPQETSPMPQGIVKSPDELRDLLAYLLSPNPQAP